VLYDSAASLLVPMKWWMPRTLCSFCVIMWLPATILSVREVNRFTAMLLGLPNAVKHECMKPISRDTPHEDGHEGQGIVTAPGYSLPIVFNAAILGFIGGTCIINIIQSKNIEDVNMLYGYINSWTLNGRSRKCRVAEGLLGLLLGILGANELTNNTRNVSAPYITESAADSLAGSANEHLNLQNKELLQDTEATPAIIGWSEEINRLTLMPLCISEGRGSIHDTYRCGSAQFLMEFFDNVVDFHWLDWKQSGGRSATTRAISAISPTSPSSRSC
jgi:hypothetical protein